MCSQRESETTTLTLREEQADAIAVHCDTVYDVSASPFHRTCPIVVGTAAPKSPTHLRATHLRAHTYTQTLQP